jgi:hypothetical protein
LKAFIFLLFGLLSACSTLKHEPLKTPKDIDKQRKISIEVELKKQFNDNNLKYSSINFGQSFLIKPPSYFILDSLYNVKFELEKRNRIDKNLEQKILNQKMMVQNDTTPIYYEYEHVFTVEDSSQLTVFYSLVTLNKNNKVETIKIEHSSPIKRNLARFYAYFKLKKAFVYPGADIDESELAFYDLYQEKLIQLSETEEEKLLECMFRVMKIANDIKSLDKSNLIKMMVLGYVQNKSFLASTDIFYSINEVYEENNFIYEVEHSYLDKNENKIKKVLVKLNPYLELIEIKEI